MSEESIGLINDRLNSIGKESVAMGTICSASQQSSSSSMMSQPMSDELIAHIAPVLLPVNDIKAVAVEVLGLTENQVDAQGFIPFMLSDPICECLKLGMERQHIRTVPQLRSVLERASRADVISAEAIKYLDSLQAECSLHEVCKHIAKYIAPASANQLFSGYFGLTQQEIKQQYPQPPDHTTVCIRILSLWKRLNPETNTVQHLIQALERAVETEVHSGAEDELKLLRIERVPYSDILREVKKVLQADKRSGLINTHRMTSGTVSTTEVESLCLKLKDRYTEDYHTLNPLPWVSAIEASILNDVFITLYVDDEEQRTTISMDDLFTQHIKGSSAPAKLILLHGEAGSGKTTLTAKIALDWATGQTHINKLLDFTAVFVIKASLIGESDTFSAYVKRECTAMAFKHLDIEQEFCAANILIIIDGYDERRNNTAFINDLLSRRMFSASTILLTSRYGATQDIRHWFKVRVGLRGFTDRDIECFVEKHADDATKKNFLEMHATEHPFISTLSNPLYLWIFVILGDDYFKDIQNFTRTEFYSQTLSGISDKAEHKLCKDNDIDEDDIKQAINKLCTLAYECMKKDTLQITDVSSVDSIMAKLGLLNAIVSRSGIRDRKVFVFAHKTIMEFLAAKYIVTASNPAEQSQSKDNHNVIPAYKHLLLFPEVKDEERRLASMVVVFVCGLLSTRKEAVIDIIRELVPDIPAMDDRHAYHFGLSCLCELDDTQWIPVEMLEGRINKRLNLDSACTPYCGHGLGKYSRVRTLESVNVDEYASRHVSYINTASLSVNGRDGSVVTSLVTALDKSCVVELEIHDTTLTGEQYSNITQHLTECSRLEELTVWDVELSGDVDRLLTTDAHAPPSLNKLTVEYSMSTHPSVWICWSWCSVSEVELSDVYLSSDDVTSIATTAQQQSAAPILRLERLDDAGTSRLLNALCNTGYVHRLQELWVRGCTSDDDCAAVGHFLSQCTQICKLTWMELLSDSPLSVAALTAMWLQIATEATHLHTVTVQECAWGSRVDDVLMSVLRELTSQQRRHIQWRVVRLMDKYDYSSVSTHPITDSECRCVYTLLPSVCEVWRGNSDGEDWVKVERG